MATIDRLRKALTDDDEEENTSLNRIRENLNNYDEYTAERSTAESDYLTRQRNESYARRAAKEQAEQEYYDSLDDLEKTAYDRQKNQEEIDSYDGKTGWKGIWSAITTDYTFDQLKQNNKAKDAAEKKGEELDAKLTTEYQKKIDAMSDDELEEAGYTDELKKRKNKETIDALPDDVLSLIDEYVDFQNYAATNDGSRWDTSYKSYDEIDKELKAKGYDNWEDLAKIRSEQREAETIEAQTEAAQEWASKNKFNAALATAESVFLQPAGAAISGVGAIVDPDYSTSSKYNSVNKYSDALREGATDTIESGIIDKATKEKVYNLGYDMLNSLTNNQIYGVAGATSAAQTYNDGLDRGLTKGQAAIEAVAAGIYEEFWERKSLGKFVKSLGGEATVKNFIKNLVEETLINFEEEAATEASNIVTDRIVAGENSEYQQRIQSYMAEGMTEEEAKKQANIDDIYQTVEAGLSGALMGAGFAGIGGVVNTANQHAGYVATGSQIAQNGQVSDYVTAAGATGNQKAEKLASDIAGQEYAQPKTEDYGTSEQTTEATDYTNDYSDQYNWNAITGDTDEATDYTTDGSDKYSGMGMGVKNASDNSTSNGTSSASSTTESYNNLKGTNNTTKSKASTAGDTVSDYSGESVEDTVKKAKLSIRQKYKVGKLAALVESSKQAEMRETLKSSVKERLTELGETSDVDKVAEAITKVIYDTDTEEQSKREAKAIANSSAGQQVLREATFGSTRYGTNSDNADWTEGAAQAQQEVIDRYKTGTPKTTAAETKTATDNVIDETVPEAETETSAEPATKSSIYTAIENKAKATGDRMSKAGIKTGEVLYDTAKTSGIDISEEEFAADYNYLYTAGFGGATAQSPNVAKYIVDSKLSQEIAEQAIAAGNKSNFSASARNEAVANNAVKAKSFEYDQATDSYVVTDEFGRKFAASQAKNNGMSDEDQSTYNAAVRLKDNDLVIIAANAYNTGETVSGKQLAKNIGKASYFGGMGINFDQAEKLPSFQKVIDAVGKDAAKKAFNRGNTLSKESKPYQVGSVKKGEGKFTASDSVKETIKTDKKAKAVAEYYKAFAARTGVNVELVDNMAKGNNAYYQMSTGTIVAGLDNSIASLHELVHVIRVADEKAYSNISTAVVDYFKQVKGEDYYYNTIAKLMEAYSNADVAEGRNLDAMNEEFVADRIAELFATDKGTDEFLSWLTDDSGYSESKIKQIIKAFVDYLKNFIEDVKAALHESEGFFSAADRNAIYKDTETAEAIRQKFLEALDGMNGVTNGDGKSDVRNSLSPTKREKLESMLINLGKEHIKLNAGDKPIIVTTNEFTINKNIYSSKSRTDRQVNARIKAIPDFSSIIKSSKYVLTDEDIHGLSNDAKKGVKAIHHFSNVYKGWNVDILILDKGKKQILYEVIFENKKDSLQKAPDNSEPAAAMNAGATNLERNSTTNGNKSQESDNRKSLISVEEDEEYLERAEDPEKNEKQLQKMVRKAAKLNGYPVEAYHGTGRADRVGTVFRPDRATSGPMAYFTSNENVAKGYASDKRDTSLAYDSDYSSYETQFRVTKNGKSIGIVDLWNKLSAKEKNNIIKRAAHVTMDEDWENVVYDESNKRGLGGFDNYRIREAKSNYLKALVDEWLTDGNLYRNEAKFTEVLKLAGLDYDVEYKDPDYREEKVYHVFLGINNPFKTSESYDEQFVNELEKYLEGKDEAEYTSKFSSADPWDKYAYGFEGWLDHARADLRNNSTGSWTSIPDFVTEFLQSKGYDGIFDNGNKGGAGRDHTVYIPFSSEQVKSADPVTYDGEGKVIPLSERFNQDKTDIRWSKITAEEDEEYLERAEDPEKNKEALQWIVENAAKRAGVYLDEYGYPKMFYHGTDSFGFTAFDNSELDDGFSIFLTDTLETASTYSGREDTKTINFRSDLVDSVKTMSGDELAKLWIKEKNALDGTNSKAEYYNTNDLKNLQSELKANIKELDKVVTPHLSDPSITGKWREDLRENTRQLIKELKETGSYQSQGTKTALDNLNYYQSYSHTLTKGLNFKINDLKKAIDICKNVNERGLKEVIVKVNNDGSSQVYPIERVRSSAEYWLNNPTGNYSLYAKLDNPLVIDGFRHNWNNIPFDGIDGEPRYYNTRDISQFAKENGYDGVIFKDIIDNGGKNEKYGWNAKPLQPATVAVVFDSSQAKSADLVTYDDEGNIIPLSERFNFDKTDIRYSLNSEDDEELDAQIDAELDKAFEEMSIDEILKMLEPVSSKNTSKELSLNADEGLPGQAAVISNERLDYLINDSGAGANTTYAQKWITSINPSNFINLTTGKNSQSREKFDNMPGDYDTTVNNYDFLSALKKNLRITPYLKVDIDTGKVIGHDGRHRMRALEKLGVTNASVVIEFYQDGYLVKRSDNGEALTAKNNVRLYNQFGTRQYANIKNVMPINEANRDNILNAYGENAASDTDIKYSKAYSAPEVEELRDQNQSLIKRNRELSNKLSDVIFATRAEAVGYAIDPAGVKKLAKQIATDNNSKVKLSDLTDKLSEAFTFMADGDFDKTEKFIKEAVEMITEKSANFAPVIDDYHQQILDDIKSVDISLSDAQKKEIANRFGSYGAYRRALFGRVNITKKGISLDQRWAELAETYPSIFDQVPDVDQPEMLADIIDTLKQGTPASEVFDVDSEKDLIEAKIYAGYHSTIKTDVAGMKDKADRQAIKTLQKELEQQIETVEAEYKAQYQKAMVQARKEVYQEFAQKRAELQARIDEANRTKASAEELKKLAEEKQRLAANSIESVAKLKAQILMRQRQRENTEARQKRRTQIIKDVKALNNMLLKPSAKNGSVPDKFKSGVAQILDAFTETTSIFDKKHLEMFRSAYEDLSGKDGEAEATGFSEDIMEDIKNLIKTIEGKRLAQLNLEELDLVQNILKNIKQIIQHENNVFINGKKASKAAVGGNIMAGLRTDKPKASHKNPLGTMVAVNNLTPVYFFKKVSGPLEDAYKGIRAGQDKYATNVTKAREYFEKTYGDGKDLKGQESFEITTTRGEKMTFTYEQAMTIYATWRREQHNPQQASHLQYGGIVYEKDTDKNGKPKDHSAHPLDLPDLIKICGKLDDKQKAYVNKMVDYLSNDMSALGNEVTMELFGYKAYNEKYYFPYNSSRAHLFEAFDQKADGRLKTMSFTKALTPRAKNPIVLSDFTDVWAKHVERMSAYNAFTVPLETFTGLWNYKDPQGIDTVKSMFATKYGQDAAKYVTDLMKDINGNVVKDSREQAVSNLIRLYKKNAVMMSLSVAIQQPSAICRAFAYVNPKYFVTSTARKPLASWEECKKYCSSAKLKDIGGFDIGSSTGITDWMTEKKTAEESKLKKVQNISDKVGGFLPEKMDAITWGHIWEAVKREQRAKTGLTGEDLLQAAAKRFEEVVDLTQVYDTTFTRSGNMRAKTGYMQAITSFMAEPTVTFNMLADAANEAKKGNKGFAAAAVASVALSVVFNAMLKSVITAARGGDDDKSYLENYIMELISNMMEDGNPLTWIPIVKDIVQQLSGWDVTRADMSSIQYLWDQAQKMWTDAEDLTEMEGTDLAWGTTKYVGNVLSNVAYALGIPVKNMNRDVWGIIKSVAKEVDPDGVVTSASGLEEAAKEGLFPTTRSIAEQFGWDNGLFASKSNQEKLYDAWVSGDSNKYNKYAENYKDGSSVRTRLAAQVKVEYLAGTITYAQAYQQLSKLQYEDIDDKIKGWTETDSTSDDEDKWSQFYTLN